MLLILKIFYIFFKIFFPFKKIVFLISFFFFQICKENVSCKKFNAFINIYLFSQVLHKCNLSHATLKYLLLILHRYLFIYMYMFICMFTRIHSAYLHILLFEELFVFPNQLLYLINTAMKSVIFICFAIRL